MKEPHSGSGSAVFLCCHPLLRRPSLTEAYCWVAALLLAALFTSRLGGLATGLCCGLCCSLAAADRRLI